MEDLNRNMGRRIAELRKEHHMTQAELAEALDISIKHCSSVERGLSRLSIEKLVEAADLLHTSLDYIVRGKCTPGQYAELFPADLLGMLEQDSGTQTDLFRRFLQLYSELLESQIKK